MIQQHILNEQHDKWLREMERNNPTFKYMWFDKDGNPIQTAYPDGYQTTHYERQWLRLTSIDRYLPEYFYGTLWLGDKIKTKIYLQDRDIRVLEHAGYHRNTFLPRHRNTPITCSINVIVEHWGGDRGWRIVDAQLAPIRSAAEREMQWRLDHQQYGKYSMYKDEARFGKKYPGEVTWSKDFYGYYLRKSLIHTVVRYEGK